MLFNKQGKSQQVITNGNNWVPVGFTSSVGVATPTSGTGTAGLNQTWDFSTQSFTSAGALNIVNAGSSTYGSNYPSATSCGVLASSLYFYWKISSTKLEALTEGISSPGVGNDFSGSPRLWLKFPFNYGDTMSQSYHAVDNSSSGMQTIKYDGTGTLKLPAGTYTNVVRIQTVRGSYTDYSWYMTNPLALVLQYSNYNNQLIAFNNSSAGINEFENENSFTISPNPFSSETIITFSSEQKNTAIKIMDVAGKEIKSELFSGKEYKLEKETMEAGIYFVQITDEKKNVVNKKIVIE